MRRASKATIPRTIDEYLATLSVEQRTTLQRLREDIRAAAPEVEECISYGIPGFRLRGRLLVSFGAAARHCAFYPGAFPLEAHRSELEAYETAKGTIRFPIGEPMSSSLVRKLVKSRIAEYAAKKPAAVTRGRRRA